MAATLDRLDLLEKAATLMQRGELTAALPEYVRLFQRHPQDWNVANTLGDLYARVGKTDEAIAHFTGLAERLAADGFTSKARAIYRKILRLRPDNEIAHHRVLELDHQCVGVSPFLQRVLQTAREAREAHVQEIAAQPAPAPIAPAEPVVPLAPEPEPPAVVVVEETPPYEATTAPQVEEWEPIVLIEPEQPAPPDDEQLFRDTESSVAAASARGEFAVAASALETFLESRPHHIAALERLIEVAVDGGLQLVESAQSRLADACRAAGFTERAKAILDDLEWRSTVISVEEEPPRESPVLAPAPPIDTPSPAPLPVIEEVEAVVEFEQFRDAMLSEAAVAAEARFAEAQRLIAVSNGEEARAHLEEAMCLPQLRVPAGARLAQVHRDRGAPIEALACLEWVAELPPATEDDGHELAYELALTLEALDQQAQALGVYRELLAEVGPTYRDVARRAERLAAA